jgi:hypothetical protein
MFGIVNSIAVSIIKGKFTRNLPVNFTALKKVLKACIFVGC